MEKKLVIMAGLPGSGKSFVRSNKYADLKVIDCDEIKKTLTGYDPKNPGLVHEQSKVLEQEAIYRALGTGESFVYDTTATNFTRVVKLIQDAKLLGYTVELCYVKVSLNTALYRNSKRERERVVPESLIREKFSLLPVALDIISGCVDSYVVVNND